LLQKQNPSIIFGIENLKASGHERMMQRTPSYRQRAKRARNWATAWLLAVGLWAMLGAPLHVFFASCHHSHAWAHPQEGHDEAVLALDAGASDDACQWGDFTAWEALPALSSCCLIPPAQPAPAQVARIPQAPEIGLSSTPLLRGPPSSLA
jgi:hypothetical protein